MSLKESFKQLEDVCHPQTNVGFSWSAKDIGFGEFVFIWNDKKNRLDIHTETMSKEFIKRMLCQMVDEATDIG
jgi:hypothetical protein